MLLHRLIFSKDNKDYKDYNDYNDYSDYNDYNNYNEYRYSYLDLDLDWERFSELVTFNDTVDYNLQIEKLESIHWGLGINREWPWQHSHFLRCFQALRVHLQTEAD